jgi:threonylcarbamoyladenosine tRNA methylthiotransferase MtaB
MNVYLDSIGCRLNQSEIELYARQFRAAGHRLVADPQDADLVVVNTCTVTAAAAADSRKKVRHAARAGTGEIAVTGCWSTLNSERAASLPGVRHVVPNQEKEDLVAEVLQLPRQDFELEPVARRPIPGARLRTRAFVKVQDGCDNRCTFCITTLARGAGRSRRIERVLEDIRSASHGGAQEVVLTGVHLGSWGQDFDPPIGLTGLVQAVLAQTDIPRVRLSSLEPWDLAEDFFSLWENPRLCRQLHLPLQSGCRTTLRRMARKTSPGEFSRLVSAARAAIPGVAITTDIIVGFPGESRAEFEQSLAFVREMAFAGGHVFTYSPRPGTAAAHMPDQVHNRTRKSRNARMRAVLAESAQAFQARFTGEVLPVLWENTTRLGPDGWQLSGLTDNYLRVTATAPQEMWNRITPVRLESPEEGGLQGEIISALF